MKKPALKDKSDRIPPAVPGYRTKVASNNIMVPREALGGSIYLSRREVTYHLDWLLRGWTR